MELAAAYLAADEIISSLDRKTEDGRRKAEAVYHVIAQQLDDRIAAWYKKTTLLSRISGARREGWEEKLWRLSRVAWLVPVYSNDGSGIDVKMRREAKLHIPSAYCIEKTPFDWRSLRDGDPPPNYRFVGYAFLVHALISDRMDLDFVSNRSLSIVYNNVCSSLSEMGASNVRNVPLAGLLSNCTPTCQFRMDRLSEQWARFVQGSVFFDGPVRRWFASFTPPNVDWINFDMWSLRPFMLYRWSTIEEAKEVVDALYYQILHFVELAYGQSSGDLRSDPLPLVRPIEKVVSEMHYSIRYNRRDAITRNHLRIDAILGQVINAIRRTIGKGGLKFGLNYEFVRFLLEDTYRKKILIEHATSAASGKYDPRRITFLRRLVQTVRTSASLTERAKFFDKLLSNLVEKGHIYFDKVTEIRFCCAHEIVELDNFTKDITDPSLIVKKFSKGIQHDNDEIEPSEVQCMYCGADLGTIWLLDISIEDTMKTGFLTNWVDGDIGQIVIRLMAGGAIKTKLQPGDVARVIGLVSGSALSREVDKLNRSSTGDKAAKEQFLMIATIVSTSRALELAGAPLSLDVVNLETVLSKDYLDTIQRIGALPKSIIPKMIEYWSKSLSGYLPDPASSIRNATIEMNGGRLDQILTRVYRTFLGFPISHDTETSFLEAIGKSEPTESKGDGSKKTGSKEASPAVLAARKKYIAEMQNPSFRFPHRKLVRIQTPTRIIIPTVVKSPMRGIGKEEDDRIYFDQVIRSICPALLLKPIEGYFASDSFVWAKRVNYGPHRFVGGRSDQRSTSVGATIPSMNIYHASMEYIPSYAMHASKPSTQFREEVSREEIISTSTCLWCGIGHDLSISVDYHKKYATAVTSIMKTPSRSFDCLTTHSKEARRTPTVLDSKIDDKLNREFDRLFNWISGPTKSVIRELALIVSSIGFADVGAKLLDSVTDNLLITAWNKYIAWAISRKDTSGARSVDRLRVISVLE